MVLVSNLEHKRIIFPMSSNRLYTECLHYYCATTRCHIFSLKQTTCIFHQQSSGKRVRRAFGIFKVHKNGAKLCYSLGKMFLFFSYFTVFPSQSSESFFYIIWAVSNETLCLRYPDTVCLNAINFIIEEQENSASSIWEKVAKIQHRNTVIS